jgi:hypothetical protein
MSSAPDPQITNFLNTILNFSNTSMILHDVLASKGLEIVPSTPIPALITDNFLTQIDATPTRDGISHRDRCKQYLITELTLIKRRYLMTHNHNLRDADIVTRIPGLVQKWAHPETESSDSKISAPSVEIPTPAVSSTSQPPEGSRNLDVSQVTIPAVSRKSNKEQGLIQFVALCQPIRTITSSVDMFTSYRRWTHQNGYGYYSSPTLTKFLRCSDKRPYESVSEKGRSQGWYLQTP